jgi:hypothetical protein
MPCGYNIAQATREFHNVSLPPGWLQRPAAQNQSVFLMDASGHFSRAGPRLAAGLAILAKDIDSTATLGLPRYDAGLISRASARS